MFQTIFYVGCGQVCLLSNQIAGFFDHQYKAPQKEVASKITFFGWVRSSVPLTRYSQKNSSIFKNLKKNLFVLIQHKNYEKKLVSVSMKIVYS